MAGQSQPSKLDAWRKFFRKSNCSIIDTIENAIRVAKIDNPNEFKDKRDQIAETLYTNVSAQECQRRTLMHHLGLESSSDSESSVNSNVPVRTTREGTSTSTVEMRDERDTVREVLRIKKALINMAEQEENLLLELLTKLQHMQLSMDTIERTGIRGVVNRFEQHKAKSVRSLARFLMKSWMNAVL